MKTITKAGKEMSIFPNLKNELKKTKQNIVISCFGTGKIEGFNLNRVLNSHTVFKNPPGIC